MKKIFLFISLGMIFILAGCVKPPLNTGNNVGSSQQSSTLKLISNNETQYFKSDDLAYWSEAEIRQYRKNQLTLSSLPEDEYEKFIASGELLDKHLLNIVYHANITENDNFFQKNINPDAKFSIQYFKREEMLATYQKPDKEDQSKLHMNPYTREVLLKKETDSDYIFEVTALNKNVGNKNCGTQEGFLFYVDAISREVVYIEKFWGKYCE